MPNFTSRPVAARLFQASNTPKLQAKYRAPGSEVVHDELDVVAAGAAPGVLLCMLDEADANEVTGLPEPAIMKIAAGLASSTISREFRRSHIWPISSCGFT